MITLVTPTRGRPGAFALTERWIARQVHDDDDIQWIVVNDGEPYEYTGNQLVVQREVSTDEGPRSSLARNLLAAIPHIKGEIVCIIEDDDWYAPDYLQCHRTALRKVELSGFTPNNHFNLRYHRWRSWVPGDWACLGSTAFRGELIPMFTELLKVKAADEAYTIDVSLWKAPVSRVRLKSYHPKHVGLKGLPGTSGYGVGHKEIGLYDGHNLQLKEWIGPEDAQAYIDLMARGK